MGLSALHMQRAKPAGAEHLSDPAGVVLVGFVAHCGQSSVYLARFHANNIEAFSCKAKEQMLAHRARFKANAFNRMREIR